MDKYKIQIKAFDNIAMEWTLAWVSFFTNLNNILARIGGEKLLTM